MLEREIVEFWSLTRPVRTASTDIEIAKQPREIVERLAHKMNAGDSLDTKIRGMPKSRNSPANIQVVRLTCTFFAP